MISQGVKIGGGVVDKYRPYKGYKLCYGNLSWKEGKVNGIIPLSLKINANVGAYGGNEVYIERYISLRINNVTIVKLLSCQCNKTTALGKALTSMLSFDLDTFYGGDMSSLTAIESIEIIKSYPDYITCSFIVEKWLEPISSGGGGVAYKLLSLIHHIIQKDSGER